MIESLDETIKQLLVEKMPLNLAEVDISFDVPNRDWSKAISKPTINIYLHDIRENVELRWNEWTVERNPDGRITRTKRGARFDLSYLITAWTTNIEDEHRLLWYVLATLIRYMELPEDVLQGPLLDQPHPIRTKVAQPDSILRNAADVWTALDNQLKPVLPYVLTVAMEPHVIQTSLMVRSRFLRFYPPDNMPPETKNVTWNSPDRLKKDVSPATLLAGVDVDKNLQIGGQVFDADNPDQVVRAEVVLVEQGLNVRTDTQGRFTFSNVILRPEYTFLVVAPGYVTARQVLAVPSPSYDFKLEPEREGITS